MKRLALIAVLAHLAAPVAAGTMQEALDAYAAGHAADAARIYNELAVAGNGRAQFNLALMFYAGEGVPQSYPDAFNWAWRAKLQGVQQSEALLERVTPAIPNADRQTLAEALFAELQPRVDNGDGRAMMAMSIINTDLLPRPDPVSAYVWQSMAATVGLEGASVFRARTFDALSDKDQAKAQSAAREAFAAWCGTTTMTFAGCGVLQ